MHKHTHARTHTHTDHFSSPTPRTSPGSHPPEDAALSPFPPALEPHCLPSPAPQLCPCPHCPFRRIRMGRHPPLCSCASPSSQRWTVLLPRVLDHGSPGSSVQGENQKCKPANPKFPENLIYTQQIIVRHDGFSGLLIFIAGFILVFSCSF